ncbi:MAG: DUF4127 family protein [Symploca sp. SIO2G7]|nr:DUF4127 family protein [Symploca sp. SIO2G7]
MKILYIPLDERPCNLYYPQMIARLKDKLELLVPPIELLGSKKQPADLNRLWHWIEAKSTICHSAILSIEMLVYGGLLPSRLHQDSVEKLTENLHQIRLLKQHNPELQILASNLIMRTPAYNSSEEEPSYYEEFGVAIFDWGWLQDKQNREGLTSQEKEKFARIEQELPQAYLEDYCTRRQRNREINQGAINLVEEGVISFLSIPQDDSAKYGFTAIDQQQIVFKIIEKRLQRRIHLYPGADEVGCTLLARAYSQLTGLRRKIYLLYSSVNSETIIPLYEDRPLGESLKSQILAAGAQVVSSPQASDFVLAVNTPGKRMQEAWDNPTKDLTYTSDRNLCFFVDQIETFLRGGKPVAIADAAFANGGETELVQLLDDTAVWDQLLAYAGWNTSCNTIGTVLATSIVGVDTSDRQALDYNKIYHLLDGWAYQTVVRRDMVNDYLPAIGASYYDFNGKEAQINQEMEHRIWDAWEQLMRNSFSEWQLEIKVFSPWHRMFEIGLHLALTPLLHTHMEGCN